MLRRKFRLKLPTRTLVLGERTLVMGILNVTLDSFSDGGRFFDPGAAAAHALEMERQGADILDIGGESTRPGSEGISAEEELRRVLPVLQLLRRKLRIPISIDTQKAVVADAAVAAGAEIINDVSALRSDPALAAVARRHRLPLILMHMRGTPRTMQQGPFARNVLQDVSRGLRAAVARAKKARISKSQLILDPGFGFGKSYEQNFALLAHLPQLAALGCPLLAGTSRKAFLGAALCSAGLQPGTRAEIRKDAALKRGSKLPPLPPEQRLWGTAATVTAAILGGAHIVRVHDVAEMVQVARIADAILLAK